MEDSLWLALLGTYLCSVGCNFVMHFRKQLKKMSMPNLDHAFQVRDFCSNFVCDYIIIITTHTATFACLRITNYTLKLQHCFLSTKNYGHNEYWFRQACWGTPRLSACQHSDKWKYTILNNMSTSTKIEKKPFQNELFVVIWLAVLLTCYFQSYITSPVTCVRLNRTLNGNIFNLTDILNYKSGHFTFVDIQTIVFYYCYSGYYCNLGFV